MRATLETTDVCVNHGGSAHTPSHTLRHRGSEPAAVTQLRRGLDPGIVTLRALSETSQDIRGPGKPGAWSGHLGDAGFLWTEAGVMARSQAAGSGVWADAPAPGVLGLLCPEPLFPEHMPCYFPRPNLFPVPSSGLAELPPQEEDGSDHPAGIRPRIHHPPRPAQLLLPSRRTHVSVTCQELHCGRLPPSTPAPGAGSLGSTSGERKQERTHPPLPLSGHLLSARCSWKGLVWGDGGREGDSVGAVGLGGVDGVGCPCPSPSPPGPCEAAGLGHSSPGLGQCPPLLCHKGQAGDPARPACWLLRPQHV